MNPIRVIHILHAAWNHYWYSRAEDDLRNTNTDLQIERMKTKLTDSRVQNIQAKANLTRAQADLIRTKTGGDNNANDNSTKENSHKKGSVVA